MSAPAIQLMAVTSDTIAAIGHDEPTNTLAIQFKSKDGSTPIYHYRNFTRVNYIEFATHRSIGSFFYARIKNNPAYPYERQC